MYNKYSKADYTSYFTYQSNQFGAEKPLLQFDHHSKASDSSIPKQSCVDCACTSLVVFFSYLVFLVTLPFSAFFTLHSIRQYERLVVYRLGRLRPIKGPGIVLILPCIDKWHKVDMRTKAFNIPPSKVCTSDGYIISIGAIIQFRIRDPMLTSLAVQNMDHALRDSAMSDMTSLLTKKSFSDIKSKRQSLAYDLQIDINLSCKDWGIEISRVELSDIVLKISPQTEKSSSMSMFGLNSQSPLQQNSEINSLVQCAQHLFSQSTSSQEKDPNTIIYDFINKFNALVNPDLIENVNATYEFKISGCGTYFLDMQIPKGHAGKGNLPSGNPDVKISLTPETFESLFNGSVTAANAYSAGNLLIEGNIFTAKKLSQVFELVQTSE